MNSINFLKKTLLVCVIVMMTSTSFAQNQTTTKSGPRKQLSTIFLAGLAGAVLGLSTLSFYGRPQDRLGNIAIGFAVGAVVGTVYTTYDTATQPQKYYGDFDYLSEKEKQLIASEKPSLPILAYQFEF